MVGEELAVQRTELLQRMEASVGELRQETEGREEAVRADVRLEAASQHHQVRL